MKKLYLICISLFFGVMAYAQNISVTSFELDQTDLAARTHGTSVKDQNGNLCALIKVRTTERGIWSFDVGMLGVRKKEMQNGKHPAEIWVYVPFGVTQISIQHNKLGTLDNYSFPCIIEKGCTYIMQLKTEKVDPFEDETVGAQYLMFQITPHDALLEVDGQVWAVSQQGIARKFVDFGSYSYRVQAENYHTLEDEVLVDDPNETQVVPINLKPNFGWIEVVGDDNLQGSSVFVDNAYIGKAPCTSEAIKSGKHVIRIVKEMYATFSETMTVTDNDTLRLAPELVADFAHVTLQVDADAEIWVNDEKKGVRSWTGDLPSGTYRIECKQSNHETTSTKVIISQEMDGQVISLDVPQPFKGSLVVESTPDLAYMYIDNEYVGKTPKLVNNIIVGQHELRLTQDGYKDYVCSIIVKKNERTQVDPKLEPLPKPKPKKEEKPKKPKPAAANDTIKKQTEKSMLFATANFAYSFAPQASFGFSVGQVKRFGWFVSAMSNFSFKALQYNYIADANGNVDGVYPAYIGESCSTRISVIGGALMKVADPLYLRAGVGFGMRVKSWYIGDERLVKMSNDSWTGVDASLGAQLHLKGFVFSLDAVTTNFKTVEAKLGIGYSF